MRYKACFVALVLLSGCVGPQVREVKIPVPVPCVTVIPERPASSLDALPLEASIYESVQGLLVDRLRMGRYVGELEAVLEACK